MKIIKKLTILILAVCLLTPCLSLLTYAADEGKIQLSDHLSSDGGQVQTGSIVKVTGVLKKQKGTWGKIEITLTYDTNMLQFQDGEGVEETSSGTLLYKGDATNDSGNRKEFYMNFKPLKAGKTVITVKESMVKDKDGNDVDYPAGGTGTLDIVGETVAPTVKPAPTPEVTVQVQGKQYTLAANFSENDIPAGFLAAKFEYQDKEYNGAYSTHFDLKLAYLTDEEEQGDFFIYEEDKEAFSPFEMIEISDTTTIVLLSNVDNVVLPHGYEKTELPSSTGWNFPVWHNSDAPNYYVLYALNNYGEKVLYQLDGTENTYQKFVVSKDTDESNEKGFMAQLSNLFENHLDKVVIGVGAIMLFLVVVVIVLSVKLYNRNAELDELYDEYGLDDEASEEDESDEAFIEDIVLDLGDLDNGEVREEQEPVLEKEEPQEEQSTERDVFLQAGIKELFPSAESKDAHVEETMSNVLETIAVPTEEKEEDTLGAVLAQQKQTEKEETYDDVLDNFSLDFIDLDD